MKPLINILLILLAPQLLAQEPVWIQMEDNYPFHITYSRIGIDQNNKIYTVSDWLHPSSYERVSLITKYLPTGNKEWSINYQADSTWTTGVYISENGYTYIIRTFSSSYLDPYSILLVIDNDGNLVFTYKSFNAHYYDVIADDNGNAYVTGHSFETGCEDKAVTAKFNSEGELQWQSCWEEPCQFSSGKYLLLDNNSYLFVIGNFITNQFISLYIAKYTLNGDLSDYKLFTVSPWYVKLIHQVAMDIDKNIYITGRYEEEEWWYHGFIYKFDSLLNEQWHDTTSLSFNLFTDMAIDDDKNLILSGYENENYSDQPHATYAKYDANGNKLWHYTNDSIKSRFNSIAIHNNNYFLTGRIRNEENYSYDYITVRLNSDGEIIDSHILEGADTTYNVGVDNIIDSNGNLICTGIYRDTARYCLTVKYDAITFKEEIIQNTPEFLKVYPNPARSNINIQLELNEFNSVEFRLYNLTGEIIKRQIINNLQPGLNTFSINTHEISNGIYMLKCLANDKIFSQKVLITK